MTRVAEIIKDHEGNKVTIVPAPVTVSFSFCTACQQWEAVVENAVNPAEAAQAVYGVMMLASHAFMAKAEPLEDGKIKVHFELRP